MAEINKLFYKFVWEGKPGKISRKQLVQHYSEGGAKMINIHLHAESLKISWIRRVFNGTMDNCLMSLLESFLPETSELLLMLALEIGLFMNKLYW